VPDTPLLAVEDLRVHFWTGSGTVHAVNGISFEIGAGETLGIVGESGCGKSVTALALLGLLPRAGRVRSGVARFDGRDLLRLNQRALRRVRGRQIAMIFQDPMTSLNPVLTIGRQLHDDEALELLVTGVRQGKHRPVVVAFARAHVHAPDDAVSSGSRSRRTSA